VRLKAIAVCALVTFAAGSAAWADPVTDPVKWSQLPRMDAYGYDYSSETTVPSLAADDFLCVDGQPVIDVHWWGSYWVPGPAWPYYTSNNFPDPTLPNDQPPGILQGFWIEFYTDIPANVDPLIPWSHPGQLLYEEFIPMAAVQEALYGKVVHPGGQEENVWQYNADLPTPFFQEADNIYWLKIQAVHSNLTIQWGWHQAEDLWHDNAVQMGFGRPGVWEILVDKDLAFELSVPEPTMVLLVGAGLVALIRRR
jgi:hypothetical protein